MAETHGGYYIPMARTGRSSVPSACLPCLLGFSLFLNDVGIGPVLMSSAPRILIFMMFGWFGVVIKESLAGLYNKQVDYLVSLGHGLVHFLGGDVFRRLLWCAVYRPGYTVPWLGGEGVGGVATNEFLWPAFEAAWPTNGSRAISVVAFEIIPAWGVPALNTIILLTSGVT